MARESSVQSKIVRWSGTCLAGLGLCLVAMSALFARSAAISAAERQVAAVAREHAAVVSREVGRGMEAARSLAQALGHAKEEGRTLSREDVSALLHGLLARNPSFLGTYTLWEPDAFDGQDAAHAGKPGHDATGRFIPYWNRASGQVQVEPLADYEKPGTGDYYLKPRQTRAESIIDPFIYRVAGKDVLMMSLVAPVLVKDAFAGIVGVDLSVDFLQGLADGVDVYGRSGELALVSHDGTIAAATGRATLPGKKAAELGEGWDTTLSEQAKAAGSLSSRRGGWLYAVEPIRVGQSTTPWTVGMRVPVWNATAAAMASVLWVVLAGLLATGLALAVLWRLAGRLARPLRELAACAGSVAGGDLEAEVSLRQDDEVGRLADAFRAMQVSLRAKAAAADSIARGDLDFQLELSSERDVLGRSMLAMRESIRAVVGETTALTRSAVNGELSARADPGRHGGEYRRIVEGLNATLGAVLEPIEEVGQVLEQLARRDLRARMQGEYRGDHAKIKAAVNETAEALQEALGQVAQAVDQVSSASSQIASTSQAVASGASEQASSLEETSSSLESLASMARRSADAAQQASALAGAARGAATQGTDATRQMKAAMERVKASARRTSEIIKDINEIAFQTNLLALNAAVESARAGEAGRGFAVVAEEVRSLALRSKEAASRTEALIQESVGEAATGEATAADVSAKLSEILAGAAQVTEIVAEISAAAKEQATGIEQITDAVAQMNKVTQQNAASSEESSSAAAELAGQAERLAGTLGTFQLGEQLR